MVTSPPSQLRDDLVVSRQGLPGGVVYVIKDPVLGRFLRFKEPEYFIARQFDGRASLEEIRQRAEEQLGASLSSATLEQFAGKLQNLGLLTPIQDKPGIVPQPSSKKRVRGNIFYLRLKVIDPDGFLERAVPKLGFLFTRSFAWISILLILLAAGVLISSWQELHVSFPKLYRPGTLFLA